MNSSEFIQQGSYNLSDEIGQNHGYAPFLSTAEKIISLVQKQKINQPGPGAYDISKPIGDSGVQAYMNKQTIIVKVQGNGTSSFRSNLNRFRNTGAKSPGPGAYKIDQDDKYKIIKSSSSKQIDLIENLRLMNNQRKVQSIPQPNYSGKCYEDIEAFAKERALPSNDNDRSQTVLVGPGSYESPSGFSQITYKGIPWSRERTQRFELKTTTGNSVGPGKYNTTRKIIPGFKKNPSPGFISETVRSHFDQLIYHTNLDAKVKLKKQEGFKNSQSPGPGQYEERFNSIKITTKAREFQFFGSSIDRFEQNERTKVGPGQYQISNSDFIEIKKLKGRSLSPPIVKLREDQISESHDGGPGPSSYNQNNYTIKQKAIKKFTQGYKGSFGTTQRRFQREENTPDIGPGKYDIDRKASSNQNGAISAFKSEIQRDRSTEINKIIPPIGSYDINQFNISTKINKQITFIKNLRNIDVIKPPFDSRAPRFFEKVIQEEDFNQNSSFISKETSQDYFKPYIKQMKAPFATSAKRLEEKNNLITPGVGHYQIEQNTWNKPSFNTNYNKIILFDQET